MKNFLLLLAGLPVFGFAQNRLILTPENYSLLKQSGKLDPAVHYFPVMGKAGENNAASYKTIPQNPSTQSSGCDCFIPLDTSFTVAEFTDGIPPDYRGDDGSTVSKALPFTFCFYGTNYNAFYINRNGNVSFTNSSSVYSSTGFPNSSDKMLAPFWADFDSNNPLSGLVYYKITPTYVIVKWESVGYYNAHADKLNTFQLIMSDGLDSILPQGVNVAFCYGDMQWTAGDASSGVNGFGGVPATVGANKGNGTNFFQVGRFSQAGTGFYGPDSLNSGVDFLDNQSIYLSTCNTSNVPPVILTPGVCDTIDVYTGDTLLRSVAVDSVSFDVSVNSVMPGHSITAGLTGSVPSHFYYDTLSFSPGYQVYTCTFVTSSLPPGLYDVTITGTDNSTSLQSTSKIVIRNNFDASMVGISKPEDQPVFKLYPNPAHDLLIIESALTAQTSFITITSVLGEKIMTCELNTKQQRIDISSLPKGVYFISIGSAKEKNRTVRFIKE
jgi:hypothetical protein